MQTFNDAPKNKDVQTSKVEHVVSDFDMSQITSYFLEKSSNLKSSEGFNILL